MNNFFGLILQNKEWGSLLKLRYIIDKLAGKPYLKIVVGAYMLFAGGLVTVALLSKETDYYPASQPVATLSFSNQEASHNTIKPQLPADIAAESSESIFSSMQPFDYDPGEATFKEIMGTKNKTLDRLKFNLLTRHGCNSDISEALGFYGLDERKIPTVWPVKGPISSGFGFRIDPFNFKRANHEGLDIYAPTGSAVEAPADGIVTQAGWQGGYGRVIFLDHGNGFSTRYGHLSLLLTYKGSQVRRGDRIGLVGSTGRSTMSHLHYEVRWEGEPINPQPFLLVQK